MYEPSIQSLDLEIQVSEPVKQDPPPQSSTKNRLQEYTQRSGIPLPIYQTVNEGVQHAPRFRSTVFVDGAYFTSPNTFTNRKAAEQDVATVALNGINQKIREEGYPLICQDTIFCKSILNEYAVKMSLEKPTYKTIQPEGLLPVFVSSLVFNGVTYTGEPGRNKKEAEQLAARAVILSISGNSESGTVIFEIIKSKFRLYAALHKVKDLNNNGYMPSAVNTGFGCSLSKGKEVEVSEDANGLPNSILPLTCSIKLTNIPAMHQPFHEFKKPKWEPSPEAFTPIVFVPPALEQPLGVGPRSAKKRNRKKKKSTKKGQIDAQFPVDVVPLAQLPPCSVAQ
ncbi:Double-stranded RNA-binding protein [Actinidia chinensis var. chinensis]|uniref:Double-stranded RNA-binding protein n=1 Tax=Actinidia chinensis var. chinensis TaxID=1590841 RepID=A0A2R6S141_ACTCC|nr:Double-stranded RNA-binding protein [Actinidia chinensis var. chinensis]